MRMNIRNIHSWELSPPDAITLQKELAHKINLKFSGDMNSITTVAGIDVSMTKYDSLFTAAVVVCRFDTLEVIEQGSAQIEGVFPYIPGLLSFREIPVVVEALQKVTTDIDVILVDGHGIAHPRRLGIASHIGLLVDVPTIGVAKSRLVGHGKEPGINAGDMTMLLDKGDHIGYIVRTKLKTKPLYISAGNRIDHGTAVKIMLRTLRGYRMPEPTRLAHNYANAVRKQVPML